MTATPNLDDDLDEALADAFAPPTDPFADDEGPGRFRIETDDQAEWAGRKLAVATRRTAEIRETADRARARIEQWQADMLAPHRRDLEFFEGLLTEYATDQRTGHGRKQVETPSVKVTTRTVPATFAVVDAERAAAALGDDHLAVTVRRVVSVAELKKAAVPALMLYDPIDKEIGGLSHDEGASFRDAEGAPLSWQIVVSDGKYSVVDGATGEITEHLVLMNVTVDQNTGTVIDGVDPVPSRLSVTVTPQAVR